MGNFQVITRLANPPASLVSKYTRKEQEFFFDYAHFVLRLIDSRAVREKLSQLLEEENVRAAGTIDLRVMVFPARPLQGRPRNILHGSYNQDAAQISLYPLKLPRDWVRREGYSLFKTPANELSVIQQKTLQEVCLSALSTLIHEVLHVKFEARNLSRFEEEGIVRKLERRYVQEWFINLPEMVVSGHPASGHGKWDDEF